MSDIEVGEYIRDIDRGEILQVEKVWKDDDRLGIKFKEYAGSNTFSKDDLKRFKHSKNILEILEDGDYVNGKCVYLFVVNSNNERVSAIAREIGNPEIEKEDIIEILTHEQYEQNCYRVGDIE
jgi:metal-responsive CopG/Arc/MetJ family transcriptional regulator